MSFSPINSLSSTGLKVRQLLIVRLNGGQLFDASYCQKMLDYAKSGIGGFILFGGELEAARLFVKQLQAAAPLPLFIASDIERGVSQQLNSASPMPCQMAVAAAIKGSGQTALDLLHQNLDSLCTEAAYAGINMPLIPVADVNNIPDNPIICTRAFSDDPLLCADLCVEYVNRIELNGLISCPKHFPGHGSSSVDSHLSLPVIDKSIEDMNKMELIPFKAAVDAGTRSIMAGHLLVPDFDDQPATLSPLVARYLRESLGFRGLIITDALNMSALKSFDKIHVKCLNAGMDILLHPDDPDAAIMELEAGLQSGEVYPDRLDKSCNRIFEIKSKLNMKEVCSPDILCNKNAAESLARLSFSLVRGEWPEDVSDRIVVTAGDEDGISKKIFSRNFKRVISIDDAASLSGSVIIAISTKVAAWRGKSGIDRKTKNKIRTVIKNAKKTAVISFGSPYVLSDFGEADLLAAAYGYEEWIQELFVKHISEGADFFGKLPLNISISGEQG
ncbi:MAG: glycoside hydrolase family 3 N-terminal domain-containing protein [Dissulfurispiraceae bacterium]|jgi:beta-glucosidase-like glycosyl hydrolase|nr:glycoside hydrolase family 3 N-terminal domain-containing protein [Dissulfurispiraceae bacterium]